MMKFFKKYKYILSVLLFVVLLLVIGFFTINMVSNKITEGYNNQNGGANNQNKKDSKTLYYFMWNKCGYCTQFTEDPNGWPALQNYIATKAPEMKIKRIDVGQQKFGNIDANEAELKAYEVKYMDTFKTVPHIAIFNHTKQKWEDAYEGSRDKQSLQKYVNNHK